MTDVGDAADRLIAALAAAFEPALADYLRPGLDRAAVVSRVEAASFTAIGPIVDLLAWHDGFDHDRAARDGVTIPAFAGGATFVGLDRLVEECPYVLPSPDWPSSWFPVLIGPENVAVDTAGPDVGAVWQYQAPWHGENRRLADSLVDLLTETAAGIEAGEITFDEHGNVNEL